MNFNGQLKKRTVNLGGGFKQSRSALLQQTQREREKRERDRSREKAAAMVVAAVTRRLEVVRFKQAFAQRWQPAGDDVNTAVFAFTVFYGDIFKTNSAAFPQLQLLMQLLRLKGTDGLTNANGVRLLRTVQEVIRKVDVFNGVQLQVAELLVQLACLIPSNGEVVLIPVLSELISRLIDTSDLSITPQITHAINVYAQREQANYIAFMASTFISDLPGFQVNFACLSDPSHHIVAALDTDSRIQLLVNCVDKAATTPTLEFFTSISWIVSSFDVSLMTRAESNSLEEELEREQEQDHEDTTESRFRKKFIREDMNDTIEKLYTREMITNASNVVKDVQLLTRLFGSLIVLKPNLKSSFIIYLIPSGFEPLLNRIVSHPVFHKFKQLDEGSLFSSTSTFNKEIFVGNVEFLQYDLFVFLELLQYRLIISNDHEMFLRYDFTREKFTDIAIFLKKFVFNIIWNNATITTNSQNSQRGEMLSELSIKVLSQVYLKDSRLHIMEKDSWLIDPTKLNLGNIVNTISLYEDKKNEVDNYSDGEGELFLQSLSGDQLARLRIFQKVPFFISFEKRVEIFQGLVDVDRAKVGFSADNFNFFTSMSHRKYNAVIRREHLLDDAYQSFNKLGQQFKAQLGIEFHNQHGKEEGIDGGGITKEFLTSVVREGFQPPLFVENDHHELYPNPQIGLKYQHRIDSTNQLEKLSYINFMGKVLGKCLYERVLVDVNFASFFLTKFNVGYKSSFDDLKSLDSELYSNLVKLLTLSDEDLSNLGLTFCLDERVDKKNITIDLIPGGSQIAVTTSTRLKFIHEVSNYKLNKMIHMQASSFLNGLYEIISKDWLAMFNPYELQLLISGESDVNVEDLKKHCVYGGFSETDQTVQDLWEIMEEMTSDERFQFVKFVTSVPRAPLLGFRALVPLFGIRNTGSDVHMLPTASTCVNLLKLPNYRNKQLLREKLLYAITAEAGFDLN